MDKITALSNRLSDSALFINCEKMRDLGVFSSDQARTLDYLISQGQLDRFDRSALIDIHIAGRLSV